MFKFFEGLVDPYAPYAETDTPPRKLWPFLRDYIRPFRKVFAITAVDGCVRAAASRVQFNKTSCARISLLLHAL